MLRRFVPLLLLALGPVHAELVFDPKTGCLVAVAYPGPGETTRWSGVCVDGKAHGVGTLTSSNGTWVQGEFSAGQPVDAKGRTVLRLQGGDTVLINEVFKDGTGAASPLTLPHPSRPVQSTPLVGRWKWASNDDSCRETHEYRADGTATIVSGNERLEVAYALLKVAGPSDVHAVVRTNLSSNGMTDCMGKVSELQRTTYTTMVFADEGNAFVNCRSLDKTGCYGGAFRVTSLMEPVEPSQPRPTRSIEEIRLVMQENAAKAQSLYVSALRTKPSLSGKFVIQLRIAPSGQVETAKLLASELDAPALESALLEWARALDFGAKAGVQPTTISWPIQFLAP